LILLALGCAYGVRRPFRNSIFLPMNQVDAHTFFVSAARALRWTEP